MGSDIQEKIKSYIEYLLEEDGNEKQELEYFLSLIPSSL